MHHINDHISYKQNNPFTCAIANSDNTLWEDRAGCKALCLSSWWLVIVEDATGLSAVCDCGIS